MARARAMTSKGAGTPRAHCVGSDQTARNRRAMVPGLISVLCLALGCGEDAPTGPLQPPPRVATAVTLSPSSVTLYALGDTIRFTATVLDQHDQVMAGVPVTYASSADSVATVDAAGLVTVAGNGSATVTATSGAVSGSATVTVEQRVEQVLVSPGSATLLAIGDTVRLAAQALDANGGTVAGVTAFDWSSADSVATVDAAGLVTAVGNGSATVTATTGAAAGGATVTVEQKVVKVRVSPESVTLFAIGNTTRIEARALDANEHVVANARFAWSSKESVARVDTTGLVTATGEGNALVQVGSGLAGASVVIRVRLLDGPARERAILEVFYRATGGPGWRDNTNWLTDAPLDEWYGVGTDPQGRVAEIELVANNLGGHLPPELGGLDELTHLRLDAASAYGIVCYRPFNPRGPGSRTGNRSGWPGTANATGTPYSRSWTRRTPGGARTNGVDLVAGSQSRASAAGGAARNANGRLTGRIPPELGDLANLEVLSLNVHELSGPLPPELGKLANLRTLGLAENHLTGSLPAELGNLTRLESLVLAVSYDLSLNPPRPPYVLSGPLPPELGNLASLQELDLRGHKFTGSLPSALGGLAQLQYLSLACNSLTGPVPPALRRLRELRHMGLFGNQLEGELPEWLGELAHLEFVDFNSNYYLAGPIPPTVGELSELVKLNLGGNRLTGPIPVELGRLANLEGLALGNNQLTGPLPSELGNLAKLENLSVFWNAGLAGPIPRALTQTSLWNLAWAGTGLCAPRDRLFQAWLANIRNHLGGQSCKLPPREIFAAFYEATGGRGWASKTGWLTDAPMSSWYGVTVEDSLVTVLELPANGLSGTLPPAVGDFVDLNRLDLELNALRGELPADLGNLVELEELDLSRNRFSGRVQPELARLGGLKRLKLSENRFEGGLPGDLTKLPALSYFNWSDSGACAPEVPWFQTWLASIATRSGPTCDGPFSLTVAVAHLSQAVQDLGGGVPLIAGRPALARVFVTADRANDHRPNALASFLADGRELHATEMALGSSLGIAEYLPGKPDQWYHAVIPAAALRPGVEMTVRIDPEGVVPSTARDEAPLPLDVRVLPPMELTIVPVVTGSAGDADVLDWIQGPGDPPLEFMRAVLPVDELELTIREPLAVAAAPDALNSEDWMAVLQDIELLREVEGGSGYWFGVVNREGDQGLAGLAQVEGRASVGIPDAKVMAHELGHGMSLLHAPCGDPGLLDPYYPHPGGTIGVHGYDVRSGELVDPSTQDLMSYCHPQWISDYNFTKALEYRIEAETRPAAQTARAGIPGSRPGRRLLLWGRVSAEGELRLDPAFTLDGPPKLPSAPGPYRVEGIAGDGTIAFTLDFDMAQVSDGGGNFLFMVPFAEDRLGSLERIVLSGPEGSETLDRETRASPLAIVMDRTTGRIQSILRGGPAVAAAAAVAADARAGAMSRERVLVSRGLPGRVP